MKKTAIIHARVSDKKQADKNLSIPGQIEAGRKRAIEIGAEVLHVFIEGKARSAWRGNRPELEDAITFCELNDVDYFITWDTSRFSRDTSTGPINRLRLRSAGTFIEYITVKIDPDTEEGFILENIYQLTDELKSRKTSTDTKRSMIKNAKAGFWNGGHLPFGYSVVPVDSRKKLVVNKKESSLVVDVFSMKEKGRGSKSIAVELNRCGLMNRGKRWNKSVIGSMLRNEVYIGKTVFGKKDRQTGRQRDRSQWVVVDSHEPIISHELWKRVQKILDSENPRTVSGSPHSTYLFTGILRCGVCGGSMQIESAKGRSKRYWYYNCRNAAVEKKHKSCRVNARELDKFLAEEICRRILSKKNLLIFLADIRKHSRYWLENRQKKEKLLTSEISLTKRKIEKLFEFMEEYGRDIPDVAMVTSRMREHEERILGLERKVRALKEERPPVADISEDDLDEIRDIFTSVLMDGKNPKMVRSFLSSFIQSVVVREQACRIEYRPESIISNPDTPVPSTGIWLPEGGLLGTRVLMVEMPDVLRLRVRRG